MTLKKHPAILSDLFKSFGSNRNPFKTALTVFQIKKNPSIKSNQFFLSRRCLSQCNQICKCNTSFSKTRLSAI